MTRLAPLLLLPALLAAQNQLAFTHATVIDSTGAPPQTDRTVVVSQGRITTIGLTERVRVPAGIRVIDATGKFLIPGLWDMHVHSAFTGWFAGNRETFLPLLIANGITGIRDVGGDLEELLDRRAQIGAGTLLGPRIFASGPMLDGPIPAFPSSIAIATPEEGVRAVQSLKRRGADFIKLQSTLPRPAYFAIIKEARRLGLPVAGHVPDAISTEEASDAGQHSIEHIDFILVAAAEPSHRQQVLEQYNANPGILADFYSATQAAAIARRLHKNGTWLCPTLTWSEETPMDEFDAKTDPRSRYLPGFVIDKVWPKLLEIDQLNVAPEKIKANRLRVTPKIADLIRTLHAEGVPFLAGTDTPVPSVYPGFSLHEEMAYLVQAGLTPMEALQTATRNPAQYLGILASSGTIEIGKRADLVLLDANPLDDIHNTRKISAIVVNGKLIDSDARETLLRQVEERNKVQ
jgi:imidazolonepropionase-like amidohydrolase